MNNLNQVTFERSEGRTMVRINNRVVAQITKPGVYFRCETSNPDLDALNMVAYRLKDMKELVTTIGQRIVNF